MPLLEDNPSKVEHCIIERFEKALIKLLASHADYQKKIKQLTEENQALKWLLEGVHTNPSKPTEANNQALPLDNHLMHQINKYIKEIDFCLAYFEQA